MTLLEECIIALNNHEIGLSTEDTKKITDKMASLFPITPWGRIDWEKIVCKVDSVEKSNVIKHLSTYNKSLDKEVYIIWDEFTLPVIKSSLKSVMDVIDDVTAVSFDTWIFSYEENYVIEFYHEREITIGLLK